VSLPAVAVSQTPEDKFREYLASRPKPQRFTEQQRELLEHVFARHSHFDADELIEKLQGAKTRVSRATVYRTLAKLVDAGLLRRIELGDRTVYDHDYGYPAHDHLVCEQCGSMTEFQSEELEAFWTASPARTAFGRRAIPWSSAASAPSATPPAPPGTAS
jgi:Fur family ferric uptake transcriptional regulator